jgi:hypothetical protein
MFVVPVGPTDHKMRLSHRAVQRLPRLPPSAAANRNSRIIAPTEGWSNLITACPTLRHSGGSPGPGRIDSVRAPLYKVSRVRRVDPTHRWRGGRVAEGGGLLNRYTAITRIVGSNPIPSATIRKPSLQFSKLGRQREIYPQTNPRLCRRCGWTCIGHPGRFSSVNHAIPTAHDREAHTGEARRWS